MSVTLPELRTIPSQPSADLPDDETAHFGDNWGRERPFEVWYYFVVAAGSLEEEGPRVHRVDRSSNPGRRPRSTLTPGALVDAAPVSRSASQGGGSARRLNGVRLG